MSQLDRDALAALAGAASLSLEGARLLLDETGASAEDLESINLRKVWAVFAERVRSRRPLERAAIRESLRHESEDVRLAAHDALSKPILGTAHELLTALRESGVRRRLVEALREVATAAKSGRPLADVDALLRATTQILSGAGSRVRNARGDALAMLDHLEAQWSGSRPDRLTTGLGDIDRAIGGLIDNLLVVGARTGVGKSAFVAGLVRNWLTHKVKVGVLAYEDDARDMAARIAACQAMVSVREVRGDVVPSGSGRAERLAQIASGLDWYSQHEHLLEVDDARPSGSAADVVASIRTMVSRGCRAVVLDNMTCVRLDGPDDRRHDLLVEAALRDIRGEAQSLHVPVFVVGHLKRGMSEADESRKPPKLSDFSNATAWENYARLALGMWRGEDGVRLRVLKQTNGPSGDDFDVQMAVEAAVVTGTTRRAPEAKPEAPTRYGR